VRRAAITFVLFAATTLPCVVRAEDAEPAPPAASYAPPANPLSGLHINGYIDIGAAKAQGDGTSFAPEDERQPIDYASDTFATSVNSRGDVASTNAGERFANGFLPHTMNIGGHASVFINTVSLDLRYQPDGAKYMAFVRLQFLPRVNDLNFEASQFLVQQAFVRITPFESQEFALTVGKFDGVFGIEYLDNEAPIRIGITPSLTARYTTGQQLGAKAFYRLQIPDAWSALSLNVAATANPPEVDALAPAAISLSGMPVFTGRLGYELNLPKFQLKAGLSGSYGPRGDQTNPSVIGQEYGVDVRLTGGWVSFGAEGVRVQLDEGGADKVGAARLVSKFLVYGYNATFALGIPLHNEIFRKLTAYLQYSQRYGGFILFADLNTSRVTPGLRLDLGENAALKVEYLRNIEVRSAPTVDNDVVTSSLVFYF
jgi:hypothetical protein